jgi:hypothetical protein
VFNLVAKWQTLPLGQLVTPEELVDLFLNATNRWYVDKENDLYGTRDRMREMLLHFLQTGLEDDRDGECYVLGKFQNEWLGGHGKPIFERVQ